MAKNLMTPKLISEFNRFCPGCGHGLIAKMIAQVLEERGVEDNAIQVYAVGCSCFVSTVIKADSIQAQHGRAPAVASGVRRARPDAVVYTYQGDGDAAAIGLSESLYAAYRNENTTAIFVNNGVFGMTGGQMAPTTLEGQKTATSIYGRNTELTGQPFKLAELIAQMPVAYVERCSLANAKLIAQTKRAIGKAFDNQLAGKGYSFVEILSPCPTNWHMDPVKAYKKLEEVVAEEYKLGVLKDSKEDSK
ncbi:MAG TPA: 2-oxoglutarate oxidoreductase [Clostridiales bacterium]|jgi:2-oxoglutarate ferredoxin oxidoreductase subunit beta|nr:2-oxoglutarate oxidoreductase [Clostridiales bacterium]